MAESSGWFGDTRATLLQRSWNFSFINNILTVVLSHNPLSPLLVSTVAWVLEGLVLLLLLASLWNVLQIKIGHVGGGLWIIPVMVMLHVHCTKSYLAPL